MSDEPTSMPVEEAEYALMASAAAVPASTAGRDEREKQLASLFVVLLLVVAVLFMLQVWRPGSAPDEGGNLRGDRQIEPVQGANAVPGLVSVWVEPGVDLDFTLARAGVSCDSETDCGWGRFVIQVGPGNEKRVVQQLGQVKGVYDAGLVYEDSDADVGYEESAVTP